MLTRRITFAARALLLATFATLSHPTAGADAVRQYLDEQSAATVTVARDALVFARERRDLAVNARDYVSLAPVEVNRSGKRSYFWFGYVWSTIDRRDGESLMGGDDQLVLLADGRPIRLEGVAQSMRELGVVRPPLTQPGRAAVPVLFPVEPEVVNFVGQARDLSLMLIHAGHGEEFSLWQDAREAVRDWTTHLSLDTL